MTTGFVVNLDNGHSGWCVETLRGFIYCGERFDPAAVEREVYAVGRETGHPHDTLCYDCSEVDSHSLRGAAREVMRDV